VITNSAANGYLAIDAVQVEAGAFATSYIPTTTLAVTRNADVVTVPTTNWSASNGAIFTTSGAPGPSSTSSVAAVQLGWVAPGGDNIVQKLYNTNSQLATASSAGTKTANKPHSSIYNRVYGATYSNGGDVQVYLDGVAGTLANPHTTPSGLSATANIGSGFNTFFYNGSISRVIAYTSALSSSDVSTVTSAIKDGPQ